MRARIGRERKKAPFDVNENVFKSGAHIYRQDCSMCHGTPGRVAGFAKQMYPAPPQLWKKHGPHGAVGVSDDAPGFSYWIVSNGIRLTSMPSFTHVLSDREMWEVSLLLKNADQKLPTPVLQIRRTNTVEERLCCVHLDFPLRKRSLHLFRNPAARRIPQWPVNLSGVIGRSRTRLPVA